jgi:hypothetical protein
MAAAIERLVDDGALRQQLKDGARRMAREWFAWDGAIERTLASCSTDDCEAAKQSITRMPDPLRLHNNDRQLESSADCFQF